VLYSHDTMGLGHMRRNLLIAETLAGASLEATVLLVCGAVQACALYLRPGIDCVTLPALRKQPNGAYDSRQLDLALDEVVALRARTIRAAVEAFRPDLLVADNVPRGALGELQPTLHDLAARSVPCVLGLRDVLDDPSAVAREWRRAHNERAIRDYYEAVWVYGDQALYDVAAECGFTPAIRRKLSYLGYLDQGERLRWRAPGALEDPAPECPFALCTVGGGQDGARLAEAFALARAPCGVRRVIVTGPDMDVAGRERLHVLARGDHALTVVDFVREPARLVARAGCLVSMGGYNTVCEALSFRKRALIVPRVVPRREQLIRAERLRDRGLVDLLHPGALAPSAISSWIADNVGRPGRNGVDLGGLDRLRQLAGELLARRSKGFRWRAGAPVESAVP
jgi:predicted glycosyltransferase